MPKAAALQDSLISRNQSINQSITIETESALLKAAGKSGIEKYPSIN